MAVSTRRRSALFTKRGAAPESSCGGPFATRAASTRDGIALKPGALLAREWRGKLERVTVLDKGFAWNGKTYGSLSQIAKTITGTNWNGHRFFGLRTPKPESLGSATTRRQDRAALSEPDGAPVGPDASNAPSRAAKDASRPRSSGHCDGVQAIERAATKAAPSRRGWGFAMKPGKSRRGARPFAKSPPHPPTSLTGRDHSFDEHPGIDGHIVQWRVRVYRRYRP